MNESDLWKKVKEELKKRRCFYYKPVDRTTAGCPDVLICSNGEFIAVELKMDQNPLTDIQAYNGKRIVEEKGRFFILRYFNDKKCCQLTEIIPEKEIVHTPLSIEQAINIIELEKKLASNTL